MKKFTHIDKNGCVRMVDVTKKKNSTRKASAQAIILISRETLDKIKNNTISKGNVLETARIAGIMAAKKTPNIIPMCHTINLTHIKINFIINDLSNSINIESSIKTVNVTGVEMEALTAVSIAALTIYDMCKSYDKKITITNICLLKKTGGKSDFLKR